MSERVTDVCLPGVSRSGFQDWGRISPAEMIARARERARRDLERAEAVLAASDEDFRVTTFVGPYARRNLQVLQQGKARD